MTGQSLDLELDLMIHVAPTPRKSMKPGEGEVSWKAWMFSDLSSSNPVESDDDTWKFNALWFLGCCIASKNGGCW